jgi:hypothetical protein
MTLPPLRLSERHQIVAFLLGVGAVIFLIWHYGLRDIARQRRSNEAFREELARSGFADQTREALDATVLHEQGVRDRLAAEWEQAVERLATFANQRALGQSNPLRIEYKVELHHTRARLDRKAAALNISLSARDLGMSEEVFTTDDPRTLMIQLRAVEKLVDLALDRRIRTLHKVHPKAPIPHARPSDQRLILEEYPVEVEFDVDFANFYDLFRVIFEAGRIFVFRNVRIVSGATAQAPLRVTAVMSALLFETPDSGH